MANNDHKQKLNQEIAEREIRETGGRFNGLGFEPSTSPPNTRFQTFTDQQASRLFDVLNDQSDATIHNWQVATLGPNFFLFVEYTGTLNLVGKQRYDTTS